jgi:hypothetical protein
VTDEAIPILRVGDVAVAVAWYARLGDAKEWEHHFEPSFPAFVSLARNGGARLFLSEHRGDATAETLGNRLRVGTRSTVGISDGGQGP